MTTLKSATLASAAALFALSSLAIAVPSTAFAQAAAVHCFGVNSCKGMSDCKSGAHDCKGMNACKGQGFKTESATLCAAQHGSETPPQQ